MATSYSVGLEFSTKLNGLTDAVKQLNRVDDAAKKLSGGANNIQAFSRASDAAAKSAQGLGSAAAGAVGGVKSLMGSVASFAAQLGLAVGAATLFKSSLDAAFSRDNAEQKLRNLTGSAQEYELALKMAKVASADFGVTQTEATNAIGDLYGRLQGVGYGLKEVNEIYRGFNVVAKQSGVQAEEAAGAFFQFSQALGKGKLNGDEFVILGERMPQLLDHIAKAAGVSRDQLSQLAQEGKLSGKVLYESMANASKSATDLKGNLTAQQVTMSTVRQRAEEIQVQLGRAFAPAFLTVMNGFADVALVLAAGFQKVSEWVQNNKTAIEGFVGAALRIGALVGLVFTVVKAYQGLQIAIAAAAAAKAFLVSLSGAGMGLVIAAAGAAAAAYITLNKTLDEAGKKVGQLQKASADEMQKIRQEIAEQQDAFSSIPEAQKKIEDGQKQITAEIQRTNTELDRRANIENALVNQATQVADAKIKAETQLNNIYLEQAKTRLDIAASDEERLAAASEVYALTVRQADLELKAAESQINAAQETARVLRDQAQLKEASLRATVKLAEAEGSLTQAHKDSLEAQREAVQIAEINLQTATAVGAEQLRVAQALRDSSVEAARLAFEMDRTAQATSRASGQVTSLASKIKESAQNTLSLAQSWDQVHQGWIEISTNMGQALIKSRDLENSGKLQVQLLYQQAEAMKGIDDAQAHLLIAQAQLLEQNVAIEKKQRDNAIAAGEWGQKVRELAGAYDEAAAAASRFGNIGGSGTGTLYGVNFGEAGKNAYFESQLTAQIDDLRNVYGNRPGQFTSGYYSIMQAAMAQASQYNNRYTSQAYNSAKSSWYKGIRGYAEGGYVNGPQMAMIGEGGESEYVIPASKMTAAMQNYGAGKRGAAVLGTTTPQVNVSIGRSVQMDGTDYVTKGDLTRGISTAVDQTLSLLRRDPGVRRSIGVNS